MWVEAEPESFTEGDPIRVQFNGGLTLVTGKFLRVATEMGSRYVVYYIRDPMSAIRVLATRTFYRWVEVDPEVDVVRVLDVSKQAGPAFKQVDERPLRLNQPGTVTQKTTRCDVQVGHQTYVLAPGDHLRVWWEDGALWSELVQENKQ